MWLSDQFSAHKTKAMFFLAWIWEYQLRLCPKLYLSKGTWVLLNPWAVTWIKSEFHLLWFVLGKSMLVSALSCCFPGTADCSRSILWTEVKLIDLIPFFLSFLSLFQWIGTNFPLLSRNHNRCTLISSQAKKGAFSSKTRCLSH